ncbi:MAG TPA: hypothetical protein PKD64_03475 [Pirellulaceae bacterium]|nr:hypothetical protein [Pirellulaceae bacterium]HMO91231.1 hypothetical protein [Pirellulaceae bacterium]HMP68585.1 hypothetical protein [Pirellulaceae bacterium]
MIRRVKQIFHSRLMLIPMGVVLGIIARWVLGVPEPVDETLRLESYDVQPSSEQTENELPLVTPKIPGTPIELPIWRDFRTWV